VKKAKCNGTKAATSLRTVDLIATQSQAASPPTREGLGEAENSTATGSPSDGNVDPHERIHE